MAFYSNAGAVVVVAIVTVAGAVVTVAVWVSLLSMLLLLLLLLLLSPCELFCYCYWCCCCHRIYTLLYSLLFLVLSPRLLLSLLFLLFFCHSFYNYLILNWREKREESDFVKRFVCVLNMTERHRNRYILIDVPPLVECLIHLWSRITSRSHINRGVGVKAISCTSVLLGGHYLLFPLTLISYHWFDFFSFFDRQEQEEYEYIKTQSFSLLLLLLLLLLILHHLLCHLLLVYLLNSVRYETSFISSEKNSTSSLYYCYNIP